MILLDAISNLLYPQPTQAERYGYPSPSGTVVEWNQRSFYRYQDNNETSTIVVEMPLSAHLAEHKVYPSVTFGVRKAPTHKERPIGKIEFSFGLNVLVTLPFSCILSEEQNIGTPWVDQHSEVPNTQFLLPNYKRLASGQNLTQIRHGHVLLGTDPFLFYPGNQYYGEALAPMIIRGNFDSARIRFEPLTGIDFSVFLFLGIMSGNETRLAHER